MEQPQVQNAIRLVDFSVMNIQMDALGTLLTQEETEKLKISIQNEIEFVDELKDIFIVTFNVNVESETSDFTLKIQASGYFKTKEIISEEFKNSKLVRLNAPAIAFPFLRSFVSTLTVNAGLGTLILPTYNFTKLSEPKK